MNQPAQPAPMASWRKLFAPLLVLAAMSGASANPADLGASWRLNGNGFRGALQITQASDGSLSGTMYGDPVTGRYAAGERVAVLMRGPANKPIQAFVAEVAPDGRSMSGVFYALNTHTAGGAGSRNVFAFTAQRNSTVDPPDPGRPVKAAGPRGIGASHTINGNGYIGSLSFEEAPDGALRGHVYGQTLEGHYAAGTGTVAFVRHDTAGRPFQFYAGDVTPSGMVGTFYALVAEAGATKQRVRFAWRATPNAVVPALTPAQARFHPRAPVEIGAWRPEPPGSQRVRVNADGTRSTVATQQQPLASVTPLMWAPGATLRVKLMGGTARVRSKVREYAQEWTQHANIRFEWVDSGPAEIKVSFNPGGSWSVLGKQALGRAFDDPTMNFGWFDDNTGDGELRRTTLHEFGHALGLIHEHQSPAAGIPWDREQVYAVCASQDPPWDRAQCDHNFFDNYSAATTNYSRHDPLSIMQYTVEPALTLDRVGIPGGASLSATDRDYIARWYPFPAADIGMLRTGDDCDEIDFRIEPGKGLPGAVLFDFRLAQPVTWFKAISVPVGASEVAYIGVQEGQTRSWPVPYANIDRSRPIRFTKAKLFGVHTLLPFTWDVMPVLQERDRVTLVWKRDRC